MSKWAIIVYGRTYEVDFRLLTRPEDFDNDTAQWCMNHILSMLKSPEKLSDNQRWAIFQSDRYRVAGLACMASDLSEDMNQDVAHRPVYTFVGFVSKQDENTSGLPPMNVEPFKKNYEKYVRPRWQEKDYQTREADQKSFSSYDEELESEKIDSDKEISNPQQEQIGEANQKPIPSNEKIVELEKTKRDQDTLNFKQDYIKIYPDNENNRKKLWAIAARQQGIFSVCLGLARKKDALTGYFLNASLSESEDVMILEKEKNTFQKHEDKVQAEKSYQKRETEQKDSFQGHDNKIFIDSVPEKEPAENKRFFSSSFSESFSKIKALKERWGSFWGTEDDYKRQKQKNQNDASGSSSANKKSTEKQFGKKSSSGAPPGFRPKEK